MTDTEHRQRTAGWIVVFIFIVLAMAGYGTSQNDDDGCYSVPTAMGTEYHCD